MVKVALGTNVFLYPMPVTLLGTMIGGKPNFMTLGWVSRVNANPPMVGCGVAKNHHTNKGIAENGTFSINFPSAKMVEKVDYCGLYSGSTTDKSSVFRIFFGEEKTVPLIRECPLSLECRVVQTVENPSNNFYIAAIVGAYADEECLTDNKPDIRKINPLLLTMPDNSYWTVGEYVGKAWNIGKRMGV